MTTESDDARLLRTVASTGMDGLDLTVEEARAMSGFEFKRLFGFASIEAVPLVGPGHLDRAPRDCRWYVRMRPAPQNPGARDRKQDGFELVVKRPKGEQKDAAGLDAEAEDARTDGNPKRIGLQAKRPDAARLEALVYLARKQGRRRRATNWPIERIQSLLCRDLLDKYVDTYLADPPPNVREDRAKRDKRSGYRGGVRAFQKAFPELEIGDVGDWLVEEYEKRAAHRKPMTRSCDLHRAKRGLRQALILVGVPPTYALDFRIPDRGMLPKTAWTPGEYDRLLRAAEGWMFNPDGTPTLIPGPDGLVQARRPPWSVACRVAWRRAIEFFAYTGSRHDRVPPTRWFREDDDPWIEVTRSEVVYYRDGDARYDGNKRRGAMIVPNEFAPTVRAWHAADLARGFDFVFHKPSGERYAGDHLVRETWAQILVDAGLAGRIPHHLKDLCIQWADDAGMDREATAVHTDTTARTIARKYGEPRRWGKLRQAAKEMSQAVWRERGGRNAETKQNFVRARGDAGSAPATSTPAGPGRRRGA